MNRITSLHPHHPKVSLMLGTSLVFDTEISRYFQGQISDYKLNIEKGRFTYNNSDSLCYVHPNTDLTWLQCDAPTLKSLTAKTYLVNCGILLTECDFEFENDLDWKFLNALHDNRFRHYLENFIRDSRKKIINAIPKERKFNWGVWEHLQQDYADAWSYALVRREIREYSEVSIDSDFSGGGYHEDFYIRCNSEEELIDQQKNLYGFISYYWNISLCNQALYSLNASLINRDVNPSSLAEYFDEFSRFRLKYLMDQYWFTFPLLGDEGNRKYYEILFQKYKATNEIEQFKLVSGATLQYLETQKDYHEAKQSERFAIIVSLITILTFGSLVSGLVSFLDITNEVSIYLRLGVWTSAVAVFSSLVLYIKRR